MLGKLYAGAHGNEIQVFRLPSEILVAHITTHGIYLAAKLVGRASHKREYFVNVNLLPVHV